jgi:hypothetical protein
MTQAPHPATPEDHLLLWSVFSACAAGDRCEFTGFESWRDPDVAIQILQMVSDIVKNCL